MHFHLFPFDVQTCRLDMFDLRAADKDDLLLVTRSGILLLLILLLLFLLLLATRSLRLVSPYTDFQPTVKDYSYKV